MLELGKTGCWVDQGALRACGAPLIKGLLWDEELNPLSAGWFAV